MTRSESETQTDTAVPARRSKTVLEILMIEEVFDGGKQPERHRVFSQRERVTGRQVRPAIAAEPVRVLAERRIAKHRSQIRTRCKQVQIDPKPFDPLRNDKGELVIRDAERFTIAARDRDDRRTPKVSNVTVRKRVRSKKIGRPGRFDLQTRFYSP